MLKLTAWFKTRTGRLITHDVSVFVTAFLATGVLDSKHLAVAPIVAAVVTAAKVAIRQILPVPAKPETPAPTP